MTPLRPLLALGAALLLGAAHAAVPVATPSLSASAYLLMDARTGAVLAERNADDPYEPASLTKIMTTYLAFRMIDEGLIRRDETVLISKRARAAEGSRMFVEAGDRVPVVDLLRGIIVQSGNDASVALAEHIGGSEEGFVQMMNTEAQRLGMRHSHFTDSSGIGGPEHYMSARDIARVSQAMILEYPDDYRMFLERAFKWNNIEQRNRNRLLWRDAAVDGIKTGYTEAARYCLAASALRPDLDDMRLIAVVLGAESDEKRNGETHTLLRWGFRFFRTEPVLDAGAAITEARAWFAEEERRRVPVGVDETLWLSLPLGAHKKLTTEFEPAGPIEAPIARGQTLGTLRVRDAEEILGERDAVALSDVPLGGWLTRIHHQLLQWMQ